MIFVKSSLVDLFSLFLSLVPRLTQFKAVLKTRPSFITRESSD